jgi:uroporphyrinogen decarboxylase
MRQAGRYHAPYRRLRGRYSFETLCRTPDLAAELAMAPVDDFGFDAAILFSDLLFPLEALGFGLSYETGPPRLDGPLTPERLPRLRTLADAVARLAFQADALSATRARLPDDKGLLGFVGGPWTLFVYAIEGTHSGPLDRANGAPHLYRALADRLVPLLIENIRLQLSAGADVVMVLDTAAGHARENLFRGGIAQDLATIAHAFPGRLGYYAKDLAPRRFEEAALAAAPWAGVGLDMHVDLEATLRSPARSGFVQGNFDPASLLLTGSALASAIDAFLEPLHGLGPWTRRGWICGLGHGVRPGTPEDSVRTVVDRVRERFA